jgi:glutamate 5-kinase
VDGLLRATKNDESPKGRLEERSEVIPEVCRITPEVRALAFGTSKNGRGGMVTKLEAAEIATRCGGVAVIANGARAGIVDRLFEGEQVGTIFLPSSRMKGKRRWLAYAAGIRGRVVVDPGAHRAITSGKASLLRKGIIRVEKEFAPMDVVSIVDMDGREFARGIANCSSEASPDRGVIFTRDNIVLLQVEK